MVADRDTLNRLEIDETPLGAKHACRQGRKPARDRLRDRRELGYKVVGRDRNCGGCRQEREENREEEDGRRSRVSSHYLFSMMGSRPPIGRVARVPKKTSTFLSILPMVTSASTCPEGLAVPSVG